jgi:REP element-mobilizing transposase RayT
MPRQERVASSTGIYHVLLRGINQQRIFEQAEDYIQFLDYLCEVRKISELTLYAYCLMGNHVHLLLKEGKEPLGTSFRQFGSRYVSWFNRKYERSGHLFQDRFKSEPVETEEYFLSVLIYIFLNPVKAGLVNVAADYEWSSRRFIDSETGMIDLPALTAIVPIASIIQKEQESKEDKDLEPMGRRRLVRSDKDVSIMLRQLCGAKNTSDFQKMPLEEQQSIVSKMRDERVPIRQIARITGVSKGIIERWGKEWNRR